MEEALREEEQFELKKMSNRARNRNWRIDGWEETEAWDSIQRNFGGATTYAPWKTLGHTDHYLKGTLESQWLTAWNDDWIICRNFGWNSITTVQWANGRGQWAGRGAPCIWTASEDCPIRVMYEDTTYFFAVLDPVSGKSHETEWLVINRNDEPSIGDYFKEDQYIQLNTFSLICELPQI